MRSHPDRPFDKLREEIAELRASRARLLTSADAERRRIERELHDDTQQHLIAVAVNLQRLGELLVTDTSAARAMLEEIRRALHEALDSLREVAQRVYPPLLLDRGLPDALRAAVLALGVPAHVETDGPARYAPEVEASVYFSCIEAVRAVADAHATHVSIRVGRVGEALVLEIDATGDRLDRVRSGEALTATRDRIDAVGGRLTVAPSTGGNVRVSATIPVPASAELSPLRGTPAPP
jgi:signal transduction histidine kinase